MTQITSPTTTTAGWKKRLEARSKISAARLDDVRDRARGQFVGTSSGERARGGVAAAEARLDQFGSTAAGQKISGATRAFGKLVAKVPVLSATADSVSVSNGVDVLKQAVKDAPRDPAAKIHLALALHRTARDMGQVRLAKALVNPTSMITRVAIQKSAALGAEDRTPLDEQLLRAAFKQASQIRKHRPTDGANLHHLARIYLIQEMPDQARQLGRLALAASAPHAGDVYVTLAETERVAGNAAGAEQYAHLAVKHGSTLGYGVLADLALEGPGSTAERSRAYEQFAVHVAVEDEVRYYGVPLNLDRTEVLKRVARIHQDKARNLVSVFSRPEDDLQAAPASSSHDNEDDRNSTDRVAGTGFSAPVVAAGWYSDPVERHELRYWDGTGWSHHVADHGVAGTDPLT